MAWRSLIILSMLLYVSQAAQLTSVITPNDGKRLFQYFKAPHKDVETAFFSMLGLKYLSESKSLGITIGAPEKESACKLAKACDTKSLPSLIYASGILHVLGSSCKHQFPKEVDDFLNSNINEKSDTMTLYMAVSSLFYTGKKVDQKLVMEYLLANVKKDNSVATSSVSLILGARLKADLTALLKAADIEDMAQQADEVDGRYLHFENDIRLTSQFMMAVAAVSDATKQAPLITQEQIVLFCNYFLRSKTAVKNTLEASYLVLGLGLIGSSTQVSIAKAEVTSGSSASEKKPAISVSVTSLLGQPMDKLSVKADSIARSSDNKVITSNVPLKFESGTYNLPLWKKDLKSGFYDVSLAVTSTGRKLVGVSDLNFKVKVTTAVSLINIELGTAEREQTGAALKKLDFNSKKSEQLKADSQQKVIMKFQVQDLADKSLLAPHQAFVRFVHEKTKQEVIFVAEPDKDMTFKFEVDLSTGGKDQFNSISGKYSMHLIIGDVIIANPIFWNFGDIVLQIGDGAAEKSKSFEEQYTPKQEIHHMFRQPEKRPPEIVSQAFTVACLLPLLLLLILWRNAGANLSDFSFSPRNLIFHLGLAGIFVLYYMFWTRWNMFTTVQYLCAVGAVTFVFGNSVLSEIANQR